MTAQPQVTPNSTSEVSGVLPHQSWTELIRSGAIHAPEPISAEQIQPASLDLRLGAKAYRVQAGFLPSNSATVAEQVQGVCLHELDLTHGAVLEQDAVYLIPLQEELALPNHLNGLASPKSTTGRLDVFTRLLTNHGQRFDAIQAGYHGPLWLEVAPKSFTIFARMGDKLNQLRLRSRQSQLTADAELEHLHQQSPLLYLPNGDPAPATFNRGLWLGLDLQASHSHGGDTLIGYRARRHTGLIDLQKIRQHRAADFWEPIYASNRPLILTPEDFYIMVSHERLRVPVNYAAEMVPFDLSAGELRVHYAGFFDPGWGCPECGNPQGAPGVLEVRAHNVPFVVEHGQPICRLEYEQLAAAPEVPYGAARGSNYAGQGLQLAKQFTTE